MKPNIGLLRRSLPRRFRQQRVLIVGCGDVGVRAAQLFGKRLRLFGTTRTADRFGLIRQSGAIPIKLDFNNVASIHRAASLSHRVIILAPPPNQGEGDPGSKLLALALRRAQAKRPHAPALKLSYISTTGVYGDCAGRQIDEQEPTKPTTARAKRRVAAEAIWHQLSKGSDANLAVLRAPGIYAHDRLPLERLAQGLPALTTDEDVFTNHIHAQDLAFLGMAAMLRIRGRRNFNATDESGLKMGDYFDKIAAHFNLPKPPRVSRNELAAQVSPMMLSFMSESRQINGSRLLRELHLRLRYPTIDATLLELKRA
jgi:nucleoside-diphosphate-sugar epimerase